MSLTPEIDRAIQEHEAQIAELYRQRSEVISQNPAFAVADAIHKATCRSNHIDQCGYEYESWKEMPTNGTKARYFARAETVLKVTDAETAIRVLGCINGVY